MFAHRPTLTSHTNPSTHPPLVWEETVCPLCGRDETELHSEAADPLPDSETGLRFAIVRCRHCRLIYTNPRPTAETIARFYPLDYAPHRKSRASERNRIPSRFWSRIFGRPCLERRGLLPIRPPGRLLDFGCGGGSYLRRMADLGWKVTGLDVSPEVVAEVRRELGCDAVSGTLPHPDLHPGSFEVITMWQALEHVHRPVEVLRSAYELLVPGGRIVIAVPNLGSLPAKWFGAHWYGLDVPRHLTHFSRETLSESLQAAGFRVESIRGLAHADWLRSSAKRAARAGVGGVLSRALRWKPVARLVAWACYALGRAECLVAVAERPR